MEIPARPKEMLTYSELEDLLVSELKKVKNLRDFCDDHNISNSQYIKLSQIKNKRNDKKYTDLITKMLELLGYKFDDHIYYRIVQYPKLIVKYKPKSLIHS